MDEAMHPLALLCFGLYGEVLPNQNGAPVRIMLPWKYGFKSAKAIVKFRFVEKQPQTAWNDAAPERVRFLLQRESERGSPALEPGHRAPPGRLLLRQDASRRMMFNGYRPGGQPVHRHGPA